MKDILGANPIAIQIPIGAEENFKGVVDLIKMKAILWHDETMGAEYDVEDIPADLADEAAEWRDKLLEGAANFDDELMELYLEGKDIPEEKIIAAIRKGCIAMECCPMLLGSSYKNKGVQPLLDYVCAFLPSPLDTPAIVGVNPDTEEKRIVSQVKAIQHLLWHLRLQLIHLWVVWYSSVFTQVRLLLVLMFTTHVLVRKSVLAVCSR